MTPRAKVEARVGIFWIYGGKLILDTTPLSVAENYGEAMTHPRSHIDHWTQLQRRGAAPVDVDYEDPPRGRVVYYPREERFMIYADRCFLVRKDFVRQIIAEMHLPAKRITTSSDDHYRCMMCLRD
jgi:hypothetical protein